MTLSLLELLITAKNTVPLPITDDNCKYYHHRVQSHYYELDKSWEVQEDFILKTHRQSNRLTAVPAKVPPVNK